MNSISSWPKWQCTTLDIEGYQTINPIQLIWHDAKEVIRSLFGNSIFDDDMMFDLMLLMGALGWEYGEWFLVHEAYCIQVHS